MATNNESIPMTMQLFTWPDYTMLAFLLLISLVIGAYFGTCKTSTTTEAYLMGNRKMKLIPITISLLASYVSGISMLGIPTDAYLNGIDYIFALNGLLIAAILMNTIFLPVFYNLKLTSCYEYLERRFDKKVRIFGSVLFGINLMTWLAMVMFVCAMTLNQVTGLNNIHLITPIICIVCITYTCWGGIKAVVWTDVFQIIIMFISLILVVIKGTIDVGGLNFVIKRNLEGERIQSPSLDTNPTSKYTLWSLSVGTSTFFLATAYLEQSMLQRSLSLPSINAAKKSVYLFVAGKVVFVVLLIYTGLLLYASFYKCDPLSAKLIQKKDQLLPLFVMKILNNYPGIPGIFVAGIVCASLSSLSMGLNSMAAVIITDYRTMYSKKLISERRSAVIMKVTIIISGGICSCLVYLIEHLGAILQVYMSVGNITNGTIVGLFTAGVLIPRINKTGALIGGISSLTFMTWLCIKAQNAIASGELTYSSKSLKTDECPTQTSSEFNSTRSVYFRDSFKLYHISYLWYSIIGILMTLICGLLVSLIIKDHKPVSNDLLAPILRQKTKTTYELANTEEMQEIHLVCQRKS